MAKTKIIKVHGYPFLINTDIGYLPKWTYLISKRMKQKKSNNILVTGFAGIGKSYLATDNARITEGLDKNGVDHFKVNQVVYTYAGYMDLVQHLRINKNIVFDEPAWVMDKHEWFKEVVRALAKTMSTTRFKLHPLWIPVINRSLLDKTIRTYLIDFQIEVRDRGIAYVYKVEPSQRTEKIYYRHICNLRYHLFDMHLCRKDSCLVCSELWKDCQIFRAQYERRKSTIQEARYDEELEKAKKQEKPQTTKGKIEYIKEHFKELLDPFKHDLSPRLVWLSLQVSRAHAYDLVKLYKELYPSHWLKKEPIEESDQIKKDADDDLNQQIEDILSKS